MGCNKLRFLISLLFIFVFQEGAYADMNTTEKKPASWTATPAKADPELQQAWNSYYGALEEMRLTIENTSMFENPQNRAKAYHALMELQAAAYNYMIAPRMTNPRILTNTILNTDLFTLGLNGPDAYYGVTFLDGRQTYQLKGRLGDAGFFSVVVQNSPGGDSLGSLKSNNMEIARDGSFEIQIGGRKASANWIPLDENKEYHYVLIRRTVPDWGNSDVGELQLDRISPIEPGYYDADEFDQTAMAERITRAEEFIRYVTHHWIIGLYDIFIGPENKKNTMNLLPGTATSSASESDSNYVMGIFSLQEDEALVLTMDEPPDGDYWGFQLADVWDRALPFQERQTSLNMTQASLNPDGGLTLVISISDPGVANWLDTAGRNEGAIVLRNYGSKKASVPRIEKVTFDELADHIPEGTKKVSPEERTQILEARRQAVLRLYGNY